MKKKLVESLVVVVLMFVMRILVSFYFVVSFEIYIEVFDFDFFYVEGDNMELMFMRGVVKYRDCVFDVFLSFVKNLLVY